VCRGPSVLQNATTGCHAGTYLVILHFPSQVAKFLVMAVLFSAIACSEFPELANLMDNTSNDFTPPSYVVGEIASTVAAQVTVTAATPASRITPFRKSSDASQQTSLFRSSRDLLLLYSILRT
jgi:hypothetical protein